MTNDEKIRSLAMQMTFEEITAVLVSALRQIDDTIASRLARVSALEAELKKYRDAEAQGRLVMLPVHQDENNDGLKAKYRVFKSRNGEAVNDCFVLRPQKDHAAREALRAYAKSTQNDSLSSDIMNWLREMEGLE